MRDPALVGAVGLAATSVAVMFLLRGSILPLLAVLFGVYVWSFCLGSLVPKWTYTLKWVSLAGLAVLGTAFAPKKRLFEQMSRVARHHPEVLLIMSWILLTVPLALSPQRSFLLAISMFVGFWFCYFVAPAFLAGNDAFPRLLSVFFLAHVVFLLLNLPSLASDPSYLWMGSIRFWGITNNGNYLGCVCWMTAAVGLYFYLRRRNLWFLFGTVLALVMLFCTTSRASWLAFALAAFVILWRKARPLLVWAIPLTLTVAFAIGALRPRIFTSFMQRGLRIQKTDALGRRDVTTGRIDIWRSQVVDALRSPVVGVGLGGVTPVFFRGERYWGRPGNNSYLSALRETGIIGLLLFLLVWGRGVWRLAKVKAPGAVCGFALGCGLLAHAVFENTIFGFGNQFAILFFTLVGIAVNEQVALADHVLESGPLCDRSVSQTSTEIPS